MHNNGNWRNDFQAFQKIFNGDISVDSRLPLSDILICHPRNEPIFNAIVEENIRKPDNRNLGPELAIVVSYTSCIPAL